MKKHLALAGRSLFILMITGFLAGCGGGAEQSNDKTFFTSGNREADQRADQRMAEQQQLTGGSNNGGQQTRQDQAVVATDKKTLYERLGGDAGVKTIVDDFITRALADPRVNWQRLGVVHGGLSLSHSDSEQWNATPDAVRILKLHLAQFIALSTGGPAQYTGKTMKAAHANMHISNPEFDAAVGDLKATLDKLQIADQEQKELLSIIESTREEIVEER